MPRMTKHVSKAGKDDPGDGVMGWCALKLLYTAISWKVVGKNVHATIPTGNIGFDQYTVPDDCSSRTYFCCFPLALANTLPWPFVTILSNFFEKKRTQNHPQCLPGLSRAVFPTTFLEIAVYSWLQTWISYQIQYDVDAWTCTRAKLVRSECFNHLPEPCDYSFYKLVRYALITRLLACVKYIFFVR